MSGYGEGLLRRRGLGKQDVVLLAKPFTPEQLLRCVAGALAKRL